MPESVYDDATARASNRLATFRPTAAPPSEAARTIARSSRLAIRASRAAARRLAFKDNGTDTSPAPEADLAAAARSRWYALRWAEGIRGPVKTAHFMTTRRAMQTNHLRCSFGGTAIDGSGLSTLNCAPHIAVSLLTKRTSSKRSDL